MSDLEIVLGIVAIVFAFAAIITSGEASYWRGKFEQTTDTDGWQDEALYWRNHFDSDAEAARVRNEQIARPTDRLQEPQQ